MNEKKSFILYFDAYPCIQALPVEQRGFLLSGIYEYALWEAREPGTGEQVLEQMTELSDAAKMVFYFITKNIRRDTEKWRDRQEQHRKAAEKRWEQAGHGGESRRGGGRRMPQSGDTWAYVDQSD